MSDFSQNNDKGGLVERHTEIARWPAYAMAFAATAVALAVRWMLEPLLLGRFPFALLFSAAVFSVWIGGWRPAALTVLVGYVVSHLLYFQPASGLLQTSSWEATGAILYLFSCGVTLVIGEKLHAERREARGHVLTLKSEAAISRDLTDQLSTTLQNIAEGVSRYDAGWLLTYANEEQKRMDGRVATALLRPTTLWEIWPAICHKPVEASLRRCMAERATIEGENYDDLFELWFNVRAYPAADGGIVVLLRDITGQKRAEAALRKSEEDYRRLFDAAAVGNVEVLLPDETLVRVNQCFSEMMRYPPAELLGKSFLDITHPDDLQASRLAVESAAHSESGRFELEKRYFRKDGSVLWVNAVGVRVGDAASDTTRLLVSLQDITTRRAAQQALRDSELRARTQLQEVEALYSSSPIGMATCSPDGRFLRINAALAEIVGAQPHSLVGKSYSEVFPSLTDMVDPAFAEVLHTRQPVLNCKVTGYAGSTPEHAREWRITLYPLLDEQGAMLAVSGIFLEVTARRNAEREAAQAAISLAALHRELEESYAVLDTLIASAPIGLSFVDRQFRFIRVNEALAAINGPSVAEHIGRSVKDVVPLIWPKAEPMYQKALAGTAVVNVEMEGEVSSNPGVLRFWLVSCYPARVAGRVIGVGTVLHEVTSQRLATQELKDADRRKDEFLATLAHELRNPLAPLRNGLQLLKLAPDKTVTFKRMQPMMERQLAHMVRLIDDLLDVGRISQGKIDLRIARVSLASVIESAIETSRPLIDAGQHTLRVQESDEPIMIDADPVRLAQVFSNLLNNAARYTPPGGQIVISQGLSLGLAQVSVCDNGIGVPAGMLERVFDMFTQISRPAGHGQQGGLGIGLALVRGLVEMHGGTVTASNGVEGRGSCFTVRVPAASSFGESAGVPLEAGGSMGRHRVLVADDNRDAASTLSLVLELMGHEVRTVFDGLEAVAVAENFMPELVLLDIGMPGIDGYEACRRIRRLSWGPRPRVVAMTGWGQDEDRRRSHDAGFDQHLVKPADPADIERLMASMDAPQGDPQAQ